MAKQITTVGELDAAIAAVKANGKSRKSQVNALYRLAEATFDMFLRNRATIAAAELRSAS